MFRSRLVPNVGLEDESPSSKSDGSPEEDTSCVGDADTSNTIGGADSSPTNQGDVTDAQSSPRHQSFNNGERKRRKLPEIPKNRKCKLIYDSSF